MNLALFYDTETTGLPLYDKPSEHPDQPHIVQLAACLIDLHTRETISSMDVIICPQQWEIPAETTAIHGITTELARDVGVVHTLATDMLMALKSAAGVRIGHNESFDARMVRIAQHRYKLDVRGLVTPEKWLQAWKEAPALCTMQLSSPVVRIPPTAKMLAADKGAKFKRASLSEAYEALIGKPLENAHSAMADVQACMAVYFALEDLKPR